jgi:hypothetical protein
MIDISSAAQGTSSTVSCGATQQTFPYPGTAYRFDPVIFHGENTEFDINEAAKQLLSLIKLPTTIDGCHMILNRWKKMQLATGNLLLISFALMVEKCQVKTKVILVLVGLASYML